MYRTFLSMVGAISLAALLLSGGCGQDVTAPDIDTISLLVVSGGSQSGVVGSELPRPLVIKATGHKGEAIRDLTVNFHVTGGGGSMFADAVSTDDRGIAEDYWTLGTSTAGAQRVEVRAVLSNGQKQIYGVFTAIAVPGPAAHIAIQAGDGQTAPSGSELLIAPAVKVSDQYSNPVPSIGVTFAIATGGGSVTGAAALTDASGIAVVGGWTLGPSAGPNSLTATAVGSGIAGNPVTFTSTATTIGDFWTIKTPMPTPRRLLAAAEDGGKVYTFGGCGSDCSSTIEQTRIEVYTPATDSWEAKAPMPTRFFWGAAAAPGNGRIYTFGGFVTGTAVQEYDPAADTWVPKAPMPTGRYGLAAVAVNGRIYAIGGSAPSNAVEEYNPATDTWTSKAPMPTPRQESAVAVIDGKIYVMGGAVGNSQVSVVEVYDPVTDTWTNRAPLPAALAVSAGADVGGKAYVFGGGSTCCGGLAVFSTTFAYDPVTDTWATKAPMPSARDEAPAVVVNGTVYVMGGADAGRNALSANQDYTP